MVASQLVEQLNLDMFGSKIIDEVAKSANMSERVIRTLDELAHALEKERHLWDYEYLSHLITVIATIGKHDRAVILGRGANFILQPDKTLKVRIVAPLEMRVKNISREFGVPEEDARRCVINAESDRMAFCEKVFQYRHNRSHALRSCNKYQKC
jgi:cytidylate kinase